MKIDNNKTTEEVQKLGLEAELLNGILNIKEQIYLQTGDNISMEVLLDFLDNAVYYSEFQIWLADVAEKETSKSERIKALLARTSAGDIVRLYDASKKLQKDYLSNIDKMISESNPGIYYGMHVNESGNGKQPTINKNSRKVLAKSLLEYNRD